MWEPPCVGVVVCSGDCLIHKIHFGIVQHGVRCEFDSCQPID